MSGGLVIRREPVGAVIRGLASSAVPAPGPAGSRPGGSVTRRRPARAVCAHAYGTALPPSGPAGSPPGGLVVRRQRSGVTWGGLLSSGVFGGTLPAGSPPHGSITRRRGARAVTGHAYGTVPPPAPGGTIQPHPSVTRRRPARATTHWIPVQTVNAPPPPFLVARSTATVTAGATSSPAVTDPRDGTAGVT